MIRKLLAQSCCLLLNELFFFLPCVTKFKSRDKGGYYFLPNMEVSH